MHRSLAMTGTEELAERDVEHLSGGQMQRVWLASCLAQETGVLLLDEPTTYLDLRYQVELLDLIRDLADHQASRSGSYCTTSIRPPPSQTGSPCCTPGRIIADGAPEDVLTGDRLTTAYGIRIDVDTDPLTGRLRTRAVGRHNARSERLSTTS